MHWYVRKLQRVLIKGDTCEQETKMAQKMALITRSRGYIVEHIKINVDTKTMNLV